MSEKTDPAKPTPDSEKFKPQNVAASGKDKGRDEANMKDVPRGSDVDRRGSSRNRVD